MIQDPSVHNTSKEPMNHFHRLLCYTMHNLSDLGSLILIWITQKKHAPRVGRPLRSHLPRELALKLRQCQFAVFTSTMLHIRTDVIFVQSAKTIKLTSIRQHETTFWLKSLITLSDSYPKELSFLRLTAREREGERESNM